MVKRGITLVEIIITISIIGLVTAIAIPNFTRARLKARESELRQNLHTVRTAAERMAADTGAWPLTLNDLTLTTAPASGFTAGLPMGVGWGTRPVAAGDWKGPYLRRVPTDPITDGAFAYSSIGGTNGPIWSSSSAVSSEGTRYNTW